MNCYFITINLDITPTLYYMTTVSCVINAIFAVGAVLGNALMLTAIWKTPSFRTPSNAFVAGLAVTDFLVGLLLQPSFVISRIARIKRVEKVLCVGGLITESLAPYLSFVTALLLTVIAVERYYHVKYRKAVSHNTAIKVYVIVLTLPLAFVVPRWLANPWFDTIIYVVAFPTGAFCFTAIPWSYFQIFRIIRRHQMQINVNQGSVSGGHTSIDIQKYRKSVITMLYILGLILLSYVPYAICGAFFYAIPDLYGSFSMAMAFLNMSATVVFISSALNPVLNCWRIREIRIFVKSAFNNFCQSVTRKCVR